MNKYQIETKSMHFMSSQISFAISIHRKENDLPEMNKKENIFTISFKRKIFNAAKHHFYVLQL